jgi:IclR family acetate operon transcriptional repressor
MKNKMKTGIKTADRTLDIIELFAREKHPLGLSEIAEIMSIPVSSAHGLIKTLQARGYIFEINRKQGYFPTKKLGMLAQIITHAIPLLATLEPHLLQLSKDTDETVVLAKRQGDSIIYLDTFECNQSVRFSPRAGEIKPMYNTASGKALLGTLSVGDLDEFMNRVNFEPITPNTYTDPTKLRQEIESSRDRGWYHVEGENIQHLMSIALPLMIGTDNYAIAIGGPIERFKPLLKAHTKKLQEVCSNIEKQYG